ncbi:hypothetical protein BSCG_00196 [Bacteroides sp. 2_2_4]|uniref:Uncharacterized protein n=1 Tax=Bacteroides ovatus (strain ATCC 8483 / DSM 1896 / JCM 5824 / BCRC 10623 / CCUG 4943 / NCTC 11153) TaxID=411476 RepID=A0AAN3ABP5_BACO1|nr:hypothetical protein BACOVA_00861 [Bacteroides ovatus ATCC 8483]EEO53271.1 hypothetical protein BSCG_00196 [Bacteroides sp. 2_2_4]CAG9880257.1 hypothetical protein BOVA115_4284 [Bacteroides ovatus]
MSSPLFSLPSRIKSYFPSDFSSDKCFFLYTIFTFSYV